MGMLKPQPPVNGASFTWTGPHGTAEISDFGPEFRWQRVYDDKRHVGLTVFSPDTGAEVVFAIVDREYDASGEDLACWKLESVTPGSKPMSLTIFND